jgi:hypothetical protein
MARQGCDDVREWVSPLFTSPILLRYPRPFFEYRPPVFDACLAAARGMIELADEDLHPGRQGDTSTLVCQ